MSHKNQEEATNPASNKMFKSFPIPKKVCRSMQWGNTKHHMQRMPEKLSIFALKKKVLNTLIITAEAAIFASLPISFS